MLPVNNAVDGTEKDGSSFVMKDDHHGCLKRKKNHQNCHYLGYLLNSRGPEADFINIKFRWGFWAYSREFPDLRFLYGFLKL
jgi:hypothetical protein